jgi:vitamin B12 transporter
MVCACSCARVFKCIGIVLIAAISFASASGWCQEVEVGQAVPAESPLNPRAEWQAQPALFQASARLTDQPEEEPIPELPPTIVPGRIGNFPAEPLEGDTVVSPNRNATPASQSGSAITVITQEQIQQGGQTSVAEVLRARLGVDVVRQGGPGGQTSVFLRGGNSGHTKVLLDGIPLNDPSSASRAFDFSTLTVDNIERIEVLRGPQSMVYGSDAIGGVVSIITKRGEGPLSLRASGMGGSFNTGQTSLSASGGSDRAYYSATGSFLSTGGISAASARNGNTEHDGFNNGTASGRFGYNVGDTWNVDYVFRYVDAAAEIDYFDFFTGLPIDNLIRKNLTKNFSNRLQLTNWMLDGLVQQKVGFNLNDMDRRDTAPDFPAFVPSSFHGQTRELDYQLSAALTETNTVSGGANYLAEDAVSSLNPEATQNIKGVWLQDAFQIGPNWFNTAGVRWDDASRAGSAQTYRVTSLYRIDPLSTAFHGSIGTGFRQPALAENLFAFGNPNLRPERSKGWDVGARQQIWEDAIYFDATYFRNDFQDLIVFDFNTFSLANVGRARSSGVELTLNSLITQQLTMNASYTFDDTLNLDTGTQLLRRPRNKMLLAFTRLSQDGRSSITLSTIYVGTRLDTNNVTLGQYTLLNLSGTYQASERVQLFARLDNVTNTFYQEVNGFGTPGFGAYGGLNVTW